MQPIVTIVIILVAAWLLILRSRKRVNRGLRRGDQIPARPTDMPSLTPWVDPAEIEKLKAERAAKQKTADPPRRTLF